MKKRFALSALAFCLALIMLPARVWAADEDGTSGTWGSLEWRYDSDTGTLTISGSGEMPDADDAEQLPFDQYRYDLTNVEIENGVTSIGKSVFRDCYGLTSVTIPDSVTSIGDEAFCYCGGLTSVSFPSHIASIGAYAFRDCGLTSITIDLTTGAGTDDDSIALSIGEEAFIDCSNLTSVDITGSVDSIGQNAFSNCPSLASVKITGDVDSIGVQAFEYCFSLTDVTISGHVGSIGKSAFSGCSELVNFNIGSVGSIGYQAFWACGSLVRFSIPNGATSLGTLAFGDCYELTTVYIPISADIGDDPFNGCYGLKDIYYGGTQEEWAQKSGQNVPIDGDLPIIHYEAEGLPSTTAHNAQELLELFALLESEEDAPALTYIDLAGDIDLNEIREELSADGLVIPEGHTVRLDLKGRKISSNLVLPMVTVRGSLTVLDSTVTSEPVVNDDDSVSYDAGGFIVDNNLNDEAVVIAVEAGGSFTLRQGRIKAYGTAISVGNNPEGVEGASRVQIDSGYVRAENGPAVSLYRMADANIFGGVLISKYNTVINVSDAPEDINTYSTVTVDGGILISNGAPVNYLPCGIYYPQNGYVNISGGEIRAKGGIGILMRNGRLSVSAPPGDQPPVIYADDTGRTDGMIGSSESKLKSGYCVVLDEKSKYADTMDGISFYLQKNLPTAEEFRLWAYPSDGRELKLNTSDANSYFIYSFGPDTVYNITFDANGGGAEDIVLPTNTDQRIDDWPVPTREGYVFRGWATSPDSLYEVADNYAFKQDTTLYAIWTAEGSYIIDFNTNTMWPGNSERRVTGPDGLVLDWPKNPPYFHPFDAVFVGWYSEPGNGTLIERNHVFTEDTVLYSYWERDPGPYTVTFDLNGGDGTGGEKITDFKGILAEHQWPEEPTREGYIFKGWTEFRDSSFVFRQEDNFYKDTTLYARWMPEDGYVITFDLNYDGAPDSTTVSVIEGEKVSRPEDPGREGFSFKGWYTDTDGTKAWSFDTAVTEAITLYAKWEKKDTEVKTYTVTFSLNYDGAPDSTTVSVIDGNKVSRPEDPGREGFSFKGWYTDTDGTKAWDFDAAVDKSITLYAKWEKDVKTYTVTFNLNYDGAPDSTTVSVIDGNKVSRPEDPGREGFSFKGWYTDPDGTKAWSFDTAVTEAITLYAKWEKKDTEVKTYTVTFSLNYDGAPDSTTVSVIDGKKVSRPSTPVREGFLFKGWYTDTDGTKAWGFDTAVTEAITLYAKWEKDGGEVKTYTITFNANGGSVSPSSAVTNADGKVALPIPSRAGYTFAGWFNAPSGGTQVMTSTVFDADTIIFAHWNQSVTEGKTYTITFNANGGLVSPSSAATNASGTVTLPVPTRAGYTFAGWYTAVSGGSAITTSTQFKEDTTIYAHWNQSSDTPSSTQYQIYTPGTTYGGSFYVSHSSAAPGTLVTVTASPWNDYKLNQLSAIRTDTGRELYLTGRYTNQYTFLMPESNVQLIGSYTPTYSSGTVNPGYPGTGTGGATTGYPQTSASARPVNWYYSGGYIRHVNSGLIPFETSLTRDMLVSVLYNMDSTSSGSPAIWASENNIIPDIYQSGLWGSDRPITREQAAMILFCYAQHKGYSTSQTSILTGYTDYDEIRSIAQPAMAWSQATGLITATSAYTLSPQTILTCGEANIILTRFISGVVSVW